MLIDDTPNGPAERLPRLEGARHEKGSALGLIAAETKATEDKTARLKALRLAREASIVAAATPPSAHAARSKKRKTA